MKYIQIQLKSFKESFKIDKLFWKLVLIELAGFITFVIAYTILYALAARSILPLMPYVQQYPNLETAAMPILQTITSLWTVFLTQIILIMVIGFVLLLLLFSFFNSWSLSKFNYRMSLKYFLKFLLVNILFTLFYITLFIIIFSISRDFTMMAYGVVVLTLLYLYLTFMNYYSIKEDKDMLLCIEDGFLFSLKIHYTIIPFIIALFVWLIFIGLSYTLFVKLLGINMNFIYVILIILIYFFLAVVLKRYFYNLYKLLIDKNEVNNITSKKSVEEVYESELINGKGKEKKFHKKRKSVKK